MVSMVLAGAAVSGCRGAGPEAAERAALVVRGEVLYRAHGCTVCHGPEGRGDGQAAKSLNPQPRDFRDLGAYLHGIRAEQIASTLATTVNPERPQMPAFSHLPLSDRRALAEFVAAMQGSGSRSGGLP